ncbi:uncharacterized protein FOMMEDRAFT_32130 [Fomitiporia mediterranea MF3/22]|uniref:uncharacterized protein n=1 Tax=Fomitiporia mediterranea (strain MF3/22) TaxID=694068 RepID=UPI00044094D1|nr:uncharacterized protein FOMMEDRAFT_32130 [Fomitiporia mediterranea MF3/22]EJC97895.1 hypothetical protein FOMMEDRAFT_32130 [Fomitiporia mediterranea MF3/22]
MRWFSVFLLLIAFVLMGFAAATPITIHFYLFSVKVEVSALIDKVSDEFRFGVWGYCSTGAKNSFGIGKAKINSKVTKGGCHDRQLGWTFKDVPGMSDDLQDAIHDGLTGAFVLHIVAAVFIFLALIFALISAAKRDPSPQAIDDAYRYPRDSEDDDSPLAKARKAVSARKKAFFTTLLAFIFTMTVFILDVAGVLCTKNTVHKKSKGHAKLGFGPAWIFVIVTFGLVIIAFLIAFMDKKKSSKLLPAEERKKDKKREETREESQSRSGSRYSQD